MASPASAGTATRVRPRADRAPRVARRRSGEPGFAWAAWGAWAGTAAAIIVGASSLDGTTGTRNATLAARATLVQWGDTGLGWATDVYPPLSTAVAALVRGDGTAMRVAAGAVVALVLVQLVRSTVASGTRRTTAVALASAAVVGAPMLAAVRDDLQSVLLVALLALALGGVARFARDGSIHGGFQAGLSLGVAVMVDPSAWVHAALLAVLAIAARPHAVAPEPHRRRAVALVVLFPAAAAATFWVYVALWFDPDPVTSLVSTVTADLAQVGHPGTALAATGLALLAALTFVAETVRRALAATPRATRPHRVRARAVLVPALVALDLLLVTWLGLDPTGVQRAVVPTLACALLLLPEGASPRYQRLVTALAVVQLALSWVVLLGS